MAKFWNRILVRVALTNLLRHRATAACAAVGATVLCIIAVSAVPVGARDEAAQLDAALGKALFERSWVPAPSSTLANDGLGPLFNARSCVQCHRTAGGGRIAIDSDGGLEDRGAVVRLSGPLGKGDATYGAQVQTRAIQGHRAEASVGLDWTLSYVTLVDGSVVELRKPEIKLNGLAYGTLAPDVKSALVLAPSLSVSARIARVDRDALSAADRKPNAAGASSGRLSRDATGRVLVFGRKATDATLDSSIAIAFSRDIGLSTQAHPQAAGDCSDRQAACRSAMHGARGGDVEIGPEIVAMMAAYLRTFQRITEPDQGESVGAQVFEAAGCAGCHQPELPGRNGQSVRLYSDLRLHDLGDGLAGIVEVAGQSAAEWRTAPLIGMAERLRAGATLLHDGRARTVPEAILWHGGAAEAARYAFEGLSSTDRAALEQYVLTR